VLSKRLFRIYVFLLIAFLFGCAPTTIPVVWQDPSTDWVHPPAPQKARIRYLRQIASLDDIRREDSGGRVFSWLSGEETPSAPLLSPYAVAADGEGRIWLTDPRVGLLYQIDLERQQLKHFRVLAGQQLRTPTGVVFDPLHKRLYLADAGAGYILVLDDSLDYLLSLKPPAGFGRAGGMAVDNSGNLYVADVLNGTVELFSVTGRYLKSLGSRLNATGKFNHPSNVAVDSQGRVYVVDSFNFRVEVISLEDQSAWQIGSLGDGPGYFARPRGIALDSAGHIYVTDAAMDNIQIFNRSGDLLLVLGQLEPGPAKFCLPAGLYFDAADRLYVADSCGQQVKIFQYLAE